MDPHWLTIYLDVPAADHEQASAFWQAATGYTLSSARGPNAEFATLVPPAGRPHLRLQRVEDGPGGIHLDLHVADLGAAVDHALATGAEQVHAEADYAVFASPAGFAFCLVTDPEPSPGGNSATPPAQWGAHRSRVDQAAIDVRSDAWEQELTFWTSLTGWDVLPAGRPDLARLATPDALPVRILLQRLDDGDTHGHVDIATDDRAAEVARLTALGARSVLTGAVWTVLEGVDLADAGPFCVTDRDPDTGRLR